MGKTVGGRGFLAVMIDLFPNATVALMWLIFMAVLFVLNRNVFKPTLALLEERKNQSDRLQDRTTELFSQTQKALKRYEEKMVQARLAASRLREDIIGRARNQERELIDRARQETEAVLEELKVGILREKMEAEIKLRQYSQDLAKTMVGKILEQDVA